MKRETHGARGSADVVFSSGVSTGEVRELVKTIAPRYAVFGRGTFFKCGPFEVIPALHIADCQISDSRDVAPLQNLRNLKVEKAKHLNGPNLALSDQSLDLPQGRPDSDSSNTERAPRSPVLRSRRRVLGFGLQKPNCSQLRSTTDGRS